jgi:hypothetical protein
MLKIKYNLDSEELKKQFLRTVILNKFEKPKSNSKNNTIIELNKKGCFKNREKISILRIYKYFFESKFKYTTIKSFKDLLLIEPEKIPNLIENIEKNVTKETKEQLKNIFKWEKFQPVIAGFFEKNVETYTCYFCNLNFINDYQDENEKSKNEFTLDHYFDKADYPYLALSLYNLVPSCYTCNSKLKKTEKINSLSPTSDKFDFNEKVKFKLFLSSKNRNFTIQKPEDIEVPLKENYSEEYKKYIDVFKLNDRYKFHKKEAFELIEKARLYPESRLEEMAKLTNQTKDQVKANIFNIPKDNENLHKRPLSKLIKDISEELKLI